MPPQILKRLHCVDKDLMNCEFVGIDGKTQKKSSSYC